MSALIIIPPKLFPFIMSRSDKLSPTDEITGACGLFSVFISVCRLGEGHGLSLSLYKDTYMVSCEDK